ncbi:MAG: Fe2+-dependent dioxygenase [Alphaproteobacteria bacterium]|nr:MAG: Fe2+-dependent dioxygenase [Alphaproteobacteria bacterium]
MLVKIENVLSKAEVAQCRSVLEGTQWVDGKITAGAQSALAKKNLQVPEDAPQARALGDIVLRALGRSNGFNSAAVPFRVFPPLFNRYDVGMKFDAHVDNAIRFIAGPNIRVRTDLSATLFLSEPEDYDGGELVIEDTYGTQSVKFAAGDMVLYPATSLHRVEEITRGSRWASFFWIQSMVKDDGGRALLYQLDQSIIKTRADLGDKHEAVLGLTAVYHNLLRKWAEV